MLRILLFALFTSLTAFGVTVDVKLPAGNVIVDGTERDLLYAGGFAELRPVALADEPVRSIESRLGLLFINGKPMALDTLWKNGTAAPAYWLWEENRGEAASRRF